MCSRMHVLVVLLSLSVSSVAFAQQAREIPRAASGRPDLSGTYDVATLTPLERPAEYGDRLVLTAEEAATLGQGGQAAVGQARFNIPVNLNNQPSDPNREAPPVGGDGSTSAAGNVGGYNSFWFDAGTGAFQVDGQWRTSIITDPANGQRPPLTPAARERRTALNRQFARGEFGRPNEGTAWWIFENGPDAPGPYDDPEIRPLGERCLAFGSVGPPMRPALYNNLKRIVQTNDYVMILAEQIHDARIIRMNQEHAPPEISYWFGDSVGHWEGDTLVVDTTNFTETPVLADASRNLHVVERFTRVDVDTLLYQFTIDDPTVWTQPWSGEYTWPATSNRLYEYACHEANYSFEGILRGARVLEAEAREQLEARD